MADTESVVTGTDAAEDTSTGRAAVAVGETAGGTAPEVAATENASSPSAVAAAKAKPRRSRKRVAPEEPTAAAGAGDGTPDAAGMAADGGPAAAESATPAPAKPRRTRKATADAEVPAPAKRAKRAPRKTAVAKPGEPGKAGEAGETKPARRTPKAKVAEAPAAAAPTTDETPEPTTRAARTGRRSGTRAPSKRKTAEAVAETAASEGTTPAAETKATRGMDGAGSDLTGGPVDDAGAFPVGSSSSAADEAAAPTGDTLTDEHVETTPPTADDRNREAVDRHAVADAESGAAHREAGGVVDPLDEAAEGTDSLGGSADHTTDAREAVAAVTDHHDIQAPSSAPSVAADAAVPSPGGGSEAPAEADPARGESGAGIGASGDPAEPASADGVAASAASAMADLAAHDADTANDEDVAASPAPHEHDSADGSAATPPTADATLPDAGSTDPAAAPGMAELFDAVPAAAEFDLAADLAVTPPADSTAGPVDDLEALLPILDERPAARAPRVDPTAVRPTLPRVLLTAEIPLEPGSAPLEHSRALAERGNYVLLAVPAEAAEVSTSVTAEGDGVLRVVNVPVDPETAADISLARADVAALDGGGFVTGIRRKFARRRLAQVRQGVWSAAAADPGWADRCADAYAPYRDAFAPQTEARVADARSVEADPVTRTGTRLAVGPTNTAGQGREWARAVRTHIPGVGTETFALSSGNSFGYDADHAISTDDWLSRTWQIRQLAYVMDNFSHVLAECAMPPFGRLNGPWANFDLAELDAAGIALALAFHGSEIRDPAAQRERVPFSPFDPDHELTRALQSKVDRLGPVVRDLDLPKFVSTPDLLHDVPGADWLPVVVDPGLWASDRVPLERDRPVVVHAPSSPFTKGTALIEPVVEELHDAGLIEYRRIKGVSHADMPAVLADADIVLDQFVFGAYGVMSVQALAAGRVTLCYLHESVTQYLPDGVPIVNADPDTLRDELERVVAERDAARRIAARGPAYVREHHDGTRSAEVLARFLGATPRAAR